MKYKDNYIKKREFLKLVREWDVFHLQSMPSNVFANMKSTPNSKWTVRLLFLLCNRSIRIKPKRIYLMRLMITYCALVHNPDILYKDHVEKF